VTGRPPGDPGGVEVRLLAGFADELGLSVEWHWEGEYLFEALERYELDVVAGGLTASSPWKRHVGFGMPYYTSHTVVGVPASGRRLSSLVAVRVATRPASGLHETPEEPGAVVIVSDDLSGIEGPVAAAAWEVEGMGYRPTGVRLQPHSAARRLGEARSAMKVGPGKTVEPFADYE
jgi:ABC-type amino acid transport substrate-binding protein